MCVFACLRACCPCRWHQGRCVPCPRGFYSLGTQGFTPAFAANLQPKTAANTPAAVAAIHAAAAGNASVQVAKLAQSHSSKPRAKICTRCSGPDKQSDGFITPRKGSKDARACGCAEGYGGEDCLQCEQVCGRRTADGAVHLMPFGPPLQLWKNKFSFSAAAISLLSFNHFLLTLTM